MDSSIPHEAFREQMARFHYNACMRTISCIVDAEHDGMSLYDVLRTQLMASDGSVRRAKRLEGGLLLNGEPSWARAIVREGQEVALAIDAPGLAGSTTDIPPEAGELSVVYQDEDIVVVDKPAGLVMYPGPSHPAGTLANRIVGWLSVRGRTTGLHAAHRLDAGTSGLVVFALNSFAKDRLASQLHTDSFAREYLAICHGVPEPREGTIDVPLGRISQNPNVYGVLPEGKPAITNYEVRRVAGGPSPLALVRLRLQTGRTHQIRIHFAHIGHPLLGDAVYGEPSPEAARPLLHSCSVSFIHPVSGKHLHFDLPLPPDMVRLLP
jgi:23S rRNA pseudouridine1911/1915/1917 synthase